MKSLSHINAWLDGRTPRERVMLIVCAGLAAAVLCWLLIYRPLQAWRETAADQRFAAVAEETAVATALTGTGASRPAAPVDDINAVVEATAAEAGVTPNLAMAANGDLGFTASSVPTGAAFAWLAAMERQGLTITSLSVIENADSTVTVEGAASGAAR